MKKYTGLKHWISILRRQPKHMQHLYGFIFAGSITALIAGFILYTDYGFWHERYQRVDETATIATTTSSESPSEMITRFWNEARAQFSGIGITTASLLEGKETYTSENK